MLSTLSKITANRKIKGAIMKLGFHDGWTNNISSSCKNWTNEISFEWDVLCRWL